jgi:hypothetical protein
MYPIETFVLGAGVGTLIYGFGKERSPEPLWIIAGVVTVILAWASQAWPVSELKWGLAIVTVLAVSGLVIGRFPPKWIDNLKGLALIAAFIGFLAVFATWVSIWNQTWQAAINPIPTQVIGASMSRSPCLRSGEGTRWWWRELGCRVI